MEHLEDLVLNNGLAGAREIFAFLTSVGSMLSGDSKKAVTATVKWDGAPSIFAGIDPADGKFFVAKKGLFNATPKMYKTMRDIDADLTGELNEKFKVALEEFSKLGIKKGVYQGDLMFTTGDVKVATIEGQKYYTFQPNTIVYAVPVNSPLASKIKKARVGVIWHTTYEGDTIADMSASFGKVIVGKLKHVPTVWMDDATYKDVSGKATFTAEETKEFRGIVSRAGTLLRTIPTAALNAISSHPDLLIMVKTYNNAKVRAGEKITNTTAHAAGLIHYLADKFKKEAESRKTPAGKAAIHAKMQTVLNPIVSVAPAHLAAIFNFQNEVVEAKAMLIKKMNQAASVGTFLRTAHGYKVTTPEGYVAIDHLTNGAVKLVDRLEFSAANFSPDVIKGWTK